MQFNLWSNISTVYCSFSIDCPTTTLPGDWPGRRVVYFCKASLSNIPHHKNYRNETSERPDPFGSKLALDATFLTRRV